jgi:hypothetical protein
MCRLLADEIIAAGEQLSAVSALVAEAGGWIIVPRRGFW